MHFFPCSLLGPDTAEKNLQFAEEDPDSPEILCTETTLDVPKDVKPQRSSSPVTTELLTAQISVDAEREMARKKEQERRRREAVNTFVLVSVPFSSSWY